ncbi:MAG: HAMP domain-containing histidine kinase [Acidimicrobiia bacterium]|nr:HAMP domain-containing histidine kinase [Acidimicrobiia bacterium]
MDLQRAPIRYLDIRRDYQTMRFLASAAIAVAMTIAVIFGMWWGSIIVIVSAILAADAWRRRTTGDSAEPTVYLDMTLIALGLIIAGTGHAGHAHAAQVAGTAAVVTAAILILPIVRSLLAIVYIAACNGAVLLAGERFALADESIHDDLVLVEQTVAVILLITVAVLLYGAARSMLKDAERTDAALTQERRANELKNEFVSMVSHELRTPLTSISGFVDTLRSAWRDLPESEIDEFLRIVTDEARHLSGLVEDVLVIPRLEAGRLPLETIDFDPREDVFASIEAIFPSGGSTREIDVAMPGAVSVNADRTRTRQIMRNLLENARKYGGDEIYVEVALDESLATFVVADNGPGVPETDRHRIFEPFEQVGKGDSRESSGIGLGLPIAAQLATAMGGRMWYEQAFPRGARFCFSLPLSATLQPITQPATT